MIQLYQSLFTPYLASITCFIFIVLYYLLSFGFINFSTSVFWKKNGIFDWVSSLIWCAMTVLLLLSFVDLCMINNPGLGYLILYYLYFMFLFTFLYAILDWHYVGQFDGITPGSWRAEFQYLIISLQTQSTLGYTSAKPKTIMMETITGVQGVFGMFYCMIFIAKAVG